MRQPLLALFALLLAAPSTRAQMPYTFSVYHQTYVPLTAGTVVNPGYVWSTDDYGGIPLGFPFRIDTMKCDGLYWQGGALVASDSTGMATFSGFMATDASLDDRAYTLGSTPMSPMRWELSGTAGHHIFKYETFNAGFDQELIDSGTMKDSVSLQIWYYEDSGIVEMRYGPSKITGTDYFAFANTMAGYVRDLDTNGNGTFYALGGNPNSPVVQTVTLVSGFPTGTMLPLSGFPSNGTVYRFTPPNYVNAVKHVLTSENLNVFPTNAHDQVTISYNGSETIRYEVLAVDGSKTRLEGTAATGTTAVNISELSAGMYLVHVMTGDESKVFRFVKM